MTKIEEKIEKVFDSGSLNSKAVKLNTAQANQFIDYIVDESVVMKNARVIPMDTPRLDIAEIDISTDVLFPASRGVILDASKKVSATTGIITLITQEVIGEVDVYDEDLRNNIEGQSFETHLMKMISARISNQLEKVGLYSKVAPGALTMDRMFDGFVTAIERSGNVVDANDGVWADRYIDKSKLTKAFKSIAPAYQQRIDALYMPGNLMIDYETKYETDLNNISRNSAFGLPFQKANALGRGRPTIKIGGVSSTITEDALAGATVLTAVGTGFTAGKTITVALGEGQEHTTTVASSNSTTITLTTGLPYAISVSNANQAKIKEVLTDGLDVLFTPKNNLIYGIQKDIQIEPQRFAQQRKTTFVYTMYIDVKIQKPTLSCVLKWLKEV